MSTGNTDARGAQRAARLAEALGRGRPRSPPPDPDSPPSESAAAERPESPPTQPITAHLLEMGFTAPHIKKALESLGWLYYYNGDCNFTLAMSLAVLLGGCTWNYFFV